MSMMDWTQDKWPEFIHQKLKHVYESEKEPREKDGDRNDREKGKDRDRELGAEGQGDRGAEAFCLLPCSQGFAQAAFLSNLESPAQR